ncbi:armadillo-type protein [Xylariomycetidae sp. FL0641]|nr:armadillo-type protein [Xylariomycetidae sp. FL0641]
MEDYRYRSQQSPRTDAPMNSLVSPARNGRPMPQPVSQDTRNTLPRRFTTDSGRVPTLSTIASQQRLPEHQDYPTALEKKKLEYERLREQRRRFEAEMQKLDQQQRQDEFELAKMQEDIGRGGGMGITGHQSEPTTPPEYRETAAGFPTLLARPNRYSTSSLISPQGLLNRESRSGSQLASPHAGILQSRYYEDQLPSRSVPASRRNSDEDEKEEALRQDPTSHRSTNALNRYSMPVTRRGNIYDNIDQTNAAGFLFRDDENAADSNNYAGIDSGEDSFPQLYSKKGNPTMLSASSATVDLASQLASGETTPTNNGWGNIARHRQQHSLTTLGSSQMATADTISPVQAGALADANTIGNRPFRHSLDLNQFNRDAPTDAGAAAAMSPASAHGLSTPPKLQTSFSSNDVPTAKNVSGTGPIAPNANAHAQNHFHHHNASMGRIPPGAMKRHSRELSGDNHIASTQPSAAFPSIQSQLHANAPSFGPSAQTPMQTPVAAGPNPTHSVNSASVAPSPYQQQYYSAYNTTSPNGNAYNMGVMTMGMQNMNINAGYSPQNYTGYNQMYQANVPQPARDSQQRIIQQRRTQDNEAMNRFANMPLEQCGGTIYELCKDQHGCRYLQKQLENRIPDQIHMIWQETNQHVVELMTDPFGNYLCQKLLEYCNDDERTILVQNAAQDMIRIALNQHGTRALQKMIDFVNTPQQVNLIIGALHNNVVQLIQDLNGNHVIQKCLNKLSSQDSNFIFTAVGQQCVQVGTHRHGCCVLQRCIDHSSGQQKARLVDRITQDALVLIKDPFGNYVVQYIIDLNEPSFTTPIVHQLLGHVGDLSRHKFSSNVIEKCLRCGNEASKSALVDELMAPGEMERLLRDSYGNYVIQTALDYAPYLKKIRLVEMIRPMLSGIRGTPYGRRLAAKVSQHDSKSGSPTGQDTPVDSTQGQIPLRPAQNRAMSSLSSGVYANGLANGVANGVTNGARPQIGYPTAAGLSVSNPQPPRLNGYPTYPGANPNGANGDMANFF